MNAKTFLLFAAILALFALASCKSGDDDDDNVGDDETNATTTTTTTPTTTTTTMTTVTGDTWTDPTSGLMWQVTPSKNEDLPVGIAHCQNLGLGGLSGWRLPTISELRTLIRGCTATETGGSCGVTDLCLDRSCEDASCDSCPSGFGPINGCYGPPELPGGCDAFWSRSLFNDPVYEGWGWFVHFAAGYVHESPGDGRYSVRCVRGN